MMISDNEAKLILSETFSKRDDTLNKGSFGQSLIIGGSNKYVGAPQFSLASLSEIVMRMGSGTSSILAPDFLIDSLYQNVKFSAIYSCESFNGSMIFNKENLDIALKKSTSVAIGMGMSDGQSKEMVNYILNETNSRLVIDADALYKCKELDFKNRAILTPHLGEFSKMLHISIDELVNNPIDYAKSFAEEHNCVIILKSHKSIITDGTDYYVNHVGNAKLSKGGSGDCLSGIICGVLSYSKDLLKSAISGSYILGSCALKTKVNEYSCLPTDIVKEIPNVISDIQNNLYNI